MRIKEAFPRISIIIVFPFKSEVNGNPNPKVKVGFGPCYKQHRCIIFFVAKRFNDFLLTLNILYSSFISTSEPDGRNGAVRLGAITYLELEGYGKIFLPLYSRKVFTL